MPNKISGWAVLFNVETVIGNSFREKIAPGAFDRSLRERPDVLALLDHDSGRVLGRTASGTLELTPNRIGLHFVLDVDGTTPDGATALGTVGRQDLRACSFGFRVRRETWDEGADDDLPLRTIEDADLFEISIVAFPAYESTSASVLNRSSDDKQKQHNFLAASRRRAEAAMRKRGMM